MYGGGGGRGGATASTSFVLILCPPPRPAFLIGGKPRWRKPCMTVFAFFVVPPLLFHGFPPWPCWPRELCLHSDPPVTTSQPFWSYYFKGKHRLFPTNQPWSSHLTLLSIHVKSSCLSGHKLLQQAVMHEDSWCHAASISWHSTNSLLWNLSFVFFGSQFGKILFKQRLRGLVMVESHIYLFKTCLFISNKLSEYIVINCYYICR